MVIRKAKILYYFFRLVQSPEKIQYIFSITKQIEIDTNKENSLLKKTLNHVLEIPGLMELYTKNYSTPKVSVEELSELPQNTLGYKYAQHMQKNNLKIDYYPAVEGQSFQDYAIRKAREDHDLWHTLTGFDTSLCGEAAVQAFGLAQLKSPLSALLLAGGFLHVLTKNQKIFFDYTEQVFAGYEMGRKSQVFLGKPLGDYMDCDINDVRKMLQISPWVAKDHG